MAARLADILTNVMDAVVTVDESQHVLFYNLAAERIFGWPEQAVLGKPLSLLIPARFHAVHANHLQQFGVTGDTSRRISGSALVFGIRHSREEFPVEASISHLNTEHGKLFTVIVRDVSERVQAKAKLDAFATEAHAILEKEKSRIARELHEPHATAAFRMVQEALANVAKHAQASKVEVHIEKSSQAVKLSIRGNGLGFSVADPRKPNSLGLMGLRERAQLLKGNVTISSHAGVGTLIDTHFPVRD